MAQYFVTTTGNDANNGTSLGTAWRTMTKAAATMVAGDTTTVSDGTYTEDTIQLQNSGTSEATRITLKAANKWGAILASTGSSHCSPGIEVNGSYVTVDGFKVTTSGAVCATYNASNTDLRAFAGTDADILGPVDTPRHHITFRNNWCASDHTQRVNSIKSNQDYTLCENNVCECMLELYNSKHSVYRNNTVQMATSGTNGSFDLLETKGGTRSTLVYNNTFRALSGGTTNAWVYIGGSSSDAGIWDDANPAESYNLLFFNNVLINDNPGFQMALALHGAAHPYIINNVFVRCVLNIQPSPSRNFPSSDPVIVNNIWSGDGGPATNFGFTWNGTAVIDYNNFFNSTSPPAQTHPIAGNPLLVNVQSDWHLQPGSPCQDTGTTVSYTGYFGESSNTNAALNGIGYNTWLGTTYDGQSRVAPWSLGIYDNATPSSSATPTLIATASAADAGTAVASIAQTVPTGGAAGNVLLWALNIDTLDTATVLPAGWTLLQEVFGTVDQARFLIAYRIATGSEPATYTASCPNFGGTSWVSSVMLRYDASGIDGSTSTADNLATTSPWTLPAVSLTTTHANTMLVYCGMVDNGPSTNPAYTAPSGFTTRVSASDTTGIWTSLFAADKAQAVAGTTGSVFGTASGGGGAGKLSILVSLYKVSTATATLTKTLGAATSFATSPVRYVRDWLSGSTSNGASLWTEIQAWDITRTNVALNKLVTANFTPDVKTLPLIVDGDNAVTGFVGIGTAAVPGTSYQVTVDLGASYKIGEIRIWHEYSDGRAYHNNVTEVSVDAVTWTTVFNSGTTGEYAETSVGHGLYAPYLPSSAGVVTKTLAGMTVAAAGSVPPVGGRVGNLSKTLTNLTFASAGTVAITRIGDLSKTLGNLTATSGGTLPVAGSLAKPLATVGKTIAATVGVLGSVTATLSVALGNVLSLSSVGTAQQGGTGGATAGGGTSLAWLSDPAAIRCALIEVGVLSNGQEITRYLSTVGYVTRSTDTPAHTAYLPIVVAGGSIRFTEQLSMDGSGGVAFGDIELFNVGGERDGWLQDIWANRPVRVYIGDPRWTRSSFQLVFSGVLSNPGLISRRMDRLNFQLRDKLQRLNTAVTEKTLGGPTANAEKLIPLCFGDCHNVAPLLTDPGTLTFQVHDGRIEQLVEVRDNGVPVEATVDPVLGQFAPAHKPFGTVTCSVQGDRGADGLTYLPTVAQLVQRLALSFGSVTQRFTAADCDTAQLASFDAAHQETVGVYLDERANVLETMQTLAQAIGAQALCSREGLLQLKQISLPVTAAMGTPVAIGAKDMFEHTLSVTDRPAIQAAVKLNYCRNWTVQANLQTGIPEEHKVLFAQEWLPVTQASDSVGSTYKVTAAPVAQESLMVARQDAMNDALRRLNTWQVQRSVYAFEGKPTLFTLTLGQPVTLTHPRFGLSQGKTGIVTALTLDWLSARISVEVLA